MLRFRLGTILPRISISRSDMPSYLGTTVETISRVMQKMSDLKVIASSEPRRFEVLDEAGLVTILGREERVR